MGKMERLRIGEKWGKKEEEKLAGEKIYIHHQERIDAGALSNQ